MLRATSRLGGGNIRYKRHRSHEEFVRGVTNRNQKKKKNIIIIKAAAFAVFSSSSRGERHPSNLWRCGLAWSVSNFCHHLCHYCFVARIRVVQVYLWNKRNVISFNDTRGGVMRELLEPSFGELTRSLRTMRTIGSYG